MRYIPYPHKKQITLFLYLRHSKEFQFLMLHRITSYPCKQQLTSTITSRGEVTRFIGVPALPIAIGLCIIYRLVIASLLLMVESPKRGAFGLRSLPAFFFTPCCVVFNVALWAWIDCALFHYTLWGCQKNKAFTSESHQLDIAL